MKVNSKMIFVTEEDSSDTPIITLTTAISRMVKPMARESILGTMVKFMMANGTKA